MYSTSPPTPQRPNPLGASSSAASTPAGGVTHKDMAPQVLKPATTPGPSIPTALAAAAAYCYAKAMGDEHTSMARPVLTALRLLPNLVMLFATRWAPGNRTYARAIWWGFLLCAVGDALVELDGLRFQGRLLRLLPLGLGLHMAAQGAFARAFVSDMPASSLQITGKTGCLAISDAMPRPPTDDTHPLLIEHPHTHTPTPTHPHTHIVTD